MTSAGAPNKQIVLVVEDEPLLRMYAIGMVEDAGFEALVATNADEAIEILVVRNDIRIVFTDIDMPGSMDGLKLATAIRGRWPPVEIVVVCDKRKLRKTDLPERSHFFTKPYSAEEVVKTLKALAA